MTQTTARHARITGRVQGVAFRAWVQRQAQARDLTGWVRNEADGTVTALIQGPRDVVQDMLAALHGGPDRARVDRVDTALADPAGLDRFEIQR